MNTRTFRLDIFILPNTEKKERNSMFKDLKIAAMLQQKSLAFELIILKQYFSH